MLPQRAGHIVRATSFLALVLACAGSGIVSPAREAVAAPPQQGISMSLLSPASGSIALGALEPEVPATYPGAISIYVEAFKTSYRFSYSAKDFRGATGTMPIGVMSYTMRYSGTVVPATPFESGEVLLEADSKGRSKTTYDFDLGVVVPLDHQPGTYTTSIVFTVVPL